MNEFPQDRVPKIFERPKDSASEDIERKKSLRRSGIALLSVIFLGLQTQSTQSPEADIPPQVIEKSWIPRFKLGIQIGALKRFLRSDSEVPYERKSEKKFNAIDFLRETACNDFSDAKCRENTAQLFTAIADFFKSGDAKIDIPALNPDAPSVNWLACNFTDEFVVKERKNILQLISYLRSTDHPFKKIVFDRLQESYKNKQKSKFLKKVKGKLLENLPEDRGLLEDRLFQYVSDRTEELHDLMLNCNTLITMGMWAEEKKEGSITKGQNLARGYMGEMAEVIAQGLKSKDASVQKRAGQAAQLYAAALRSALEITKKQTGK